MPEIKGLGDANIGLLDLATPVVGTGVIIKLKEELLDKKLEEEEKTKQEKAEEQIKTVV